jgi:hypothetical protein
MGQLAPLQPARRECESLDIPVIAEDRGSEDILASLLFTGVERRKGRRHAMRLDKIEATISSLIWVANAEVRACLNAR